MSDIDESYRKCLAMERDRERKHRKTAKATTGANALHCDASQMQDEAEGVGFDASDNGAGAEAIYDAVDAACFDGANHYTRSRRRALDFVRRRAPSALSTLKAILRNASNREESIWELTRV